MKKVVSFLSSLAAASMLMAAVPSPVHAEGDYSCVLMKFTDDTRFDSIDTQGTLSDLVLERLLNSGKFNFKETKVIDADMERMLYEERAAEFQNARASMEAGKFDVLFEGSGYNETKAQNIATATLGQFISPSITSAIGAQHNVEYLIQGTIINIGKGNWLNMDALQTAMYSQTALSMVGAAAGAASFLGPVGVLMSGFNVKETGIGIQADLRVIKADTGEVIWYKRVVGKNIQKQTSLMGGLVKIGSDKLSNEMYFKAVDQSVQIIADALIADAAAGKLFVK